MSKIIIYPHKGSELITIYNATIVKFERDYDGTYKIYYLPEGATRPDDILLIKGTEEDFKLVKIED